MSTPVVLVVDDDAAVLTTITLRLERAGYRVLGATSGLQAVQLLESRSDIVLVLSDCTMAPMTGPDLARLVLARWPHIAFVAMSGRPPASDLPEGVRFVPKPIRSADLIALVESVNT